MLSTQMYPMEIFSLLQRLYIFTGCEFKAYSYSTFINIFFHSYILPSAIIKNLEILHTFGNLFKNKSVIKISNWSLSHTLKNVTFYKHTYVKSKTYNTPQRNGEKFFCITYYILALLFGLFFDLK